MKKRITISTTIWVVWISVVLVALAGAVARAEPPENLTVQWWNWSSGPSCDLLKTVSPCAVLEGVWVAIFVRDPDIEALSITISYRDQNGRDLTRTQLVPRQYKPRPDWTNELFPIGKAAVRSILVVPLKAAEQTVLIESAGSE